MDVLVDCLISLRAKFLWFLFFFLMFTVLTCLRFEVDRKICFYYGGIAFFFYGPIVVLWQLGFNFLGHNLL